MATGRSDGARSGGGEASCVSGGAGCSAALFSFSY